MGGALCRLAEDASPLRDRHAARRAGRHPRRALLADDHVIAAEEDNVAGPVEAADAERLFLDLSGLRGPRCEASRHLARDGLGRARESLVEGRQFVGRERSRLERLQRCRRRLRQSLTQPPYFVELPSGVWFEARVGSMRTFYQSGEYANGLIVTDARTLRSRPRSFWAGLLAQLSTDNAPEAGHFVEKASTYLFHPSRAP